jgi:hypothetical protein
MGSASAAATIWKIISPRHEGGGAGGTLPKFLVGRTPFALGEHLRPAYRAPEMKVPGKNVATLAAGVAVIALIILVLRLTY